nr:unnamed protein product [Digitaria exilis]
MPHPRPRPPPSPQGLQLVVPQDRPRQNLQRAPSPVVTEDLQPPPPPSEKCVAVVAESTSALTLQEPDASASGVLLDYTSSEESATDSDDDSPPSDSSLGSKILFRRTPKWYQVYFIRTDRSGYFRMYPDLGGPFQSLDQADCAISSHLAKLQLPSVFKEEDGFPSVERLIHEHNYYPDGTPKRGPNSRSKTHPNEEQCHLVEALLDQYNEYNNLFEDLAHDLESLLRPGWIIEKNRCYYHFNFTTKAGKLFFAEVSKKFGERAWKVNCCCIIDSNENGHCYGCRNNGSPDMKHPNNTDAHTAGRLDVLLPFGEEEPFSDDVSEAARLRVLFKDHNPDAINRIYLRAMELRGQTVQRIFAYPPPFAIDETRTRSLFPRLPPVRASPSPSSSPLPPVAAAQASAPCRASSRRCRDLARAPSPRPAALASAPLALAPHQRLAAVDLALLEACEIEGRAQGPPSPPPNLQDADPSPKTLTRLPSITVSPSSSPPPTHVGPGSLAVPVQGTATVDAHEFESLVRHEWIYEDEMWFYHLNFTTKTKEANSTMSSSNLFFAGVSHMQGEDAWKVNCCCIINSKDDGHCYGCRNNGSPDMQHPNDTNAYIGGHLDGYLPFGDDELSGSDSEDV